MILSDVINNSIFFVEVCFINVSGHTSGIIYLLNLFLNINQIFKIFKQKTFHLLKTNYYNLLYIPLFYEYIVLYKMGKDPALKFLIMKWKKKK